MSPLVILGGAVGLAVTVGLAVVVSLVTSEAKGNVPVLCRRLLDRTAARLPEEMRDRREEWESDLKDVADRPITQMVIAARIWRDGRALAQEATAGVAEAEASGDRRMGKPAGLATVLAFLERPIALGRRVATAYGSPARLVASLGILVGSLLGVAVGLTRAVPILIDAVGVPLMTAAVALTGLIRLFFRRR